MPSGTGLDLFAERFPERTFDVGIAEQHAVTFAAGLAADGMKPFARSIRPSCSAATTRWSTTWPSSACRCASPSTAPAWSAPTAPTHAGSFDVGYLGALPGMVLMAAADEAELARMVATAAAIDDRPSRLPLSARRGRRAWRCPTIAEPLEIGKGRIVREGTAVAILSFGTRLAESLKAADLLAARGLSATVADARFAKPLDEELILRLAREHEALITVEEGAIGGFGAFVLQVLAEHGALDRGLKVRTLILPDIFQDQDKPEVMYAQAGLDAEGIVRGALAALGADNVSAAGRRA